MFTLVNKHVRRGSKATRKGSKEKKSKHSKGFFARVETTMMRLITLHAKKTADKYEKATMCPLDVQKERLLSIVTKNKKTEYGQRWGFGSIKSIADYQRLVPVVTYEDIRGYVDRVTAGEKKVLTAEDPVMFARTSGTMGEPKYISVTPTCQGKGYNDLMSIWGYHLLSSHPAMQRGKTVSLVSCAVEGYTEGGIPYGSTSGSIYKKMPAIFRRKYVIPYRVFEISDYQAKYYVIMRLGMEDDITGIATANPSSILLMCEKGNEFAEEIIQDIRYGTLSHKYAIEPEIRSFIEKRLKANPERSEFLAKIRKEAGGVLKPADYWPGLSLISCWKGGTVGHYIEKFPMWFSSNGSFDIAVRDWGYLSSEARCSIPISDEGSAGILAIETNFYEFVGVEERVANPEGVLDWEFLTADQLKDGKEYFIFITTTGGLYRYDINDIVRVEGYYNETPKIAFMRKGEDVSNMTGEKLSANQIIEAARQAGAMTSVAPSHFKAEADIDESRYILRIELGDHTSKDDCRGFLKCFDESLMRLNIEYKAKRNSMRIGDPVLHVMRQGWYDRWQKRLVENGSRAFQGKIQVLSAFKSGTKETNRELDRVIEM